MNKDDGILSTRIKDINELTRNTKLLRNYETLKKLKAENTKLIETCESKRWLSLNYSWLRLV